MKSLSVLLIREAVEVNTLDIVSIEPTWVKLRGPNFSNVIELRINDVKSPEFYIVDQRTISARLADEISLVPIKTIEALAVISAAVGSIKFVASGPLKQGEAKLLQQFIKLAMTTPGSDFFHKKDGGGLLRLSGVLLHPDKSQEVMAQIMQLIEHVSDQIITSQARRYIPPSERLINATIFDLKFNWNATTIDLSVELTTGAGRKIVAVFPVGTPEQVQ